MLTLHHELYFEVNFSIFHKYWNVYFWDFNNKSLRIHELANGKVLFVAWIMAGVIFLRPYYFDTSTVNHCWIFRKQMKWPEQMMNRCLAHLQSMQPFCNFFFSFISHSYWFRNWASINEVPKMEFKWFYLLIFSSNSIKNFNWMHFPGWSRISFYRNSDWKFQRTAKTSLIIQIIMCFGCQIYSI